MGLETREEIFNDLLVILHAYYGVHKGAHNVQMT